MVGRALEDVSHLDFMTDVIKRKKIERTSKLCLSLLYRQDGLLVDVVQCGIIDHVLTLFAIYDTELRIDT